VDCFAESGRQFGDAEQTVGEVDVVAKTAAARINLIG
jgi:hypothetical protein